MYKIYNPLNSVLNAAYDYVVENDRKYYNEYFRITEEFIKDEKLILGGNLSIDLQFLSKNKLQSNKYLSDIGSKTPYIIYSKSPFNHANQLADKFLLISNDKFPSEFITIKTIVKYQHLIIEINMRPLIHFINIPNFHGVVLYDLVETKSIQPLFSQHPINVLFDTHLLYIYHKLYLPQFCSEWKQLLQYENDLYNSMKTEFKKKFSELKVNKAKELKPHLMTVNENVEELEKIGGCYFDQIDNDELDSIDYFEQEIDENSYEYSNDKIIYDDMFKTDFSKDNVIYEGGYTVKHNDEQKNVITSLLKSTLHKKIVEYISKNNFVILNIGNNYFNDNSEEGRMQIIIDKEERLTEIKKYLESASSNPEIGFLFKKNEINIIEDSYLHKWFFNITHPSFKNGISILFEAFNSISYELIPYSIKTYQSIKYNDANLFVKIRFKFIDLWLLKIKINEKPELLNSIVNHINKFIDKITFYRNQFINITEEQITDIFQFKNYSGIYINSLDLHKQEYDKAMYYYPAKKNKAEPESV